MNKNIRWGMGVCVAALALALNSGVATAQQKAPDAPVKADVKKVEPPKADAKKAAEPAKKAEVKKAPSPCAGIEETGCIGNTECMWVKEVVTKAGQKRKAHCQKKPTPPATTAKKAEPKKAAEPVKADAKKAAPAPQAPAPKAAAPATATPEPKKN